MSLLIWFSLITCASLLPLYEHNVETGYNLFPFEDKLAHIVMYAGLAWLIGRRIITNGPYNWLLVIITSSTYGILMEILQELLNTGRQFEFYDILANIFGSLSGTMLIYMLYKYKSKD